MSSKTVLVVEDDPSIRDLLVCTLRDDGYEVVAAPDGLRAIQVLDERAATATEPDVILLDMMLPHLDGLGVLHHMTDHDHSTPVIALSASEWYLHAAETGGARAAIAKPFDLNQVLDVAARVSTKTA